MTEDSFEQHTSNWRRAYEDRLRSDWGWLTVTGLYWIDEGRHSIGSGTGCTIRLAEAEGVPAHAADLIRTGNEVSLEVTEPGSVLLDGQPASAGPLRFAGTQGERYVIGQQSFLVVRRGDRVGVRTWDNGSAQRAAYRGSDWFPAHEEWQVTAVYREFAEPRLIRWLNVIGDEKEQLVGGAWHFSLAGQELSLISLSPPDAGQFFVLRDGTSGYETYGASRFLSAPAPENGRTVLDFNRLYNPPCAFTPHATCPLPPRENVLSVRIEAGEKLYSPEPL